MKLGRMAIIGIQTEPERLHKETISRNMFNNRSGMKKRPKNRGMLKTEGFTYVLRYENIRAAADMTSTIRHKAEKSQ